MESIDSVGVLCGISWDTTSTTIGDRRPCPCRHTGCEAVVRHQLAEGTYKLFTLRNDDHLLEAEVLVHAFMGCGYVVVPHLWTTNGSAMLVASRVSESVRDRTYYVQEPEWQLPFHALLEKIRLFPGRESV